MSTNLDSDDTSSDQEQDHFTKEDLTRRPYPSNWFAIAVYAKENSNREAFEIFRHYSMYLWNTNKPSTKKAGENQIKKWTYAFCFPPVWKLVALAMGEINSIAELDGIRNMPEFKKKIAEVTYDVKNSRCLVKYCLFVHLKMLNHLFTTQSMEGNQHSLICPHCWS
jgi:hypothetical protein